MRTLIFALAVMLFLPGFLLGPRPGGGTGRQYVAIGDSITYGQFASPLTDGYVYLIAGDNNFSLTNRGIPSEYTCQAGNDEVFPFYAPLSTDTTVFSILLGTNDAAFEGVGPNEALYENCLTAEAAWLSIPNTSKVYAQAATITGRWAADNTDFLSGIAEKIPSAGSTGSTLSFTITTRGGALYIWYTYNFSGTAAFSYAVDGGGPTTVTPTCSFFCAQPNTGIVRITGLSNASHTVLITDTVGQPIVIAGVGTVPANVTSPACCRVLVGGVLQQESDTQSAATAAYNTDSLGVSAALVSDGLDVAGVIVRSPGTSNPPTPNFVCITSTCMFNQYHPNNLGHRDLANSFESFGF
jgi:hypothetical protein